SLHVNRPVRRTDTGPPSLEGKVPPPDPPPVPLRHAPPTTAIDTLSLHDALPICLHRARVGEDNAVEDGRAAPSRLAQRACVVDRWEADTSDVRSPDYLVSRRPVLLVERKARQANDCAGVRPYAGPRVRGSTAPCL